MQDERLFLYVNLMKNSLKGTRRVRRMVKYPLKREHDDPPAPFLLETGDYF